MHSHLVVDFPFSGQYVHIYINRYMNEYMDMSVYIEYQYVYIDINIYIYIYIDLFSHKFRFLDVCPINRKMLFEHLEYVRIPRTC